MTFVVKEFPSTSFVGFSTPVSVPQQPDDFSEMSAHKLEQLANLRQIKADVAKYATNSHYYAINEATGDPHYLVGVQAEKEIAELDYFNMPAGTYAVFSEKVADRPAADAFIAASYGELYQSPTVQINGNYLIEIVDCFILENTDEFTIYVPVTTK
ncbi:hypothetical protein BAU15_11380 [Enterococcus sp. JM4C]|uniref:effector binding domain-containing protein n=1 Tax=Candidatus Enterococcus huntleyi TaxID=1857217 RepID=UPI00137A6390|nr:effector binding domain-containing protein [Enterococcus sp. JM4C]KAF1297344.1 hypothetical protein BAU15_11380 [Enterococcus sp. JM4C]